MSAPTASPAKDLEQKRMRPDAAPAPAVVVDVDAPAAPPPPSPPVPPAPSPLSLRFRLPGSSDVLTLDVDDATELGLLRFLLEAQTQIPAGCIKLLAGFPPKAVDADDSVLVKTLFRRGDMITLQKGEAQVKRGHTDGKYVPPSSARSIFVKRTVPGDNSCCFHALAYVLEDKSRTKGPELRARIAETVLANPQKFTEAYLGQHPTRYARWIMQKDSWGGAIEIDIAAFLYQTEIISLDLQSSRVDRFGVTEGFSTRAFIAYSGDHFDALAMANSLSQGNERDDQVLFNPRDDKVMQAAMQFVRSEGKK